MQAIADLRVEMAQLNGKIDLTNLSLSTVIKTLEEQKKTRKWLVTTAISTVVAASSLLYFIIRVG